MNRLDKEGHKIEELDGQRCSIVEKLVEPERLEFLKKLLELNGLTVIVVPTPPPPAKPAPKAPAPVEGEAAVAIAPAAPAPPPIPTSFTIGVTDISFHPMLAVYERSLRNFEGKPVSIAFWNQEPEKKGELYWERRQR